MNKSFLRNKYKVLRNQLTESDIEEKSLLIANQLIEIDIFDKTFYHIFLPIIEKNEVNTEFILHILQGKDKEIIVSKSNFETISMSHFLLTDNTKFIKNSYNIPEPINGIEVPTNKIEVVFVPLLAFDKSGNRVGYGKGFYDVFLASCNPETIKVGLSFFEAEDLISDISNLDYTLDFCITPNKVYQF